LYVTVRAAGPKQLETECARVRGLLASLLLDAHAATFRSLQGWLTTQPLGLDRLVMRRTFDTLGLPPASRWWYPPRRSERASPPPTCTSPSPTGSE
jgi:hypothetical protein